MNIVATYVHFVRIYIVSYDNTELCDKREVSLYQRLSGNAYRTFKTV